MAEKRIDQLDGIDENTLNGNECIIVQSNSGEEAKKLKLSQILNYTKDTIVSQLNDIIGDGKIRSLEDALSKIKEIKLAIYDKIVSAYGRRIFDGNDFTAYAGKMNTTVKSITGEGSLDTTYKASDENCIGYSTVDVKVDRLLTNGSIDLYNDSTDTTKICIDSGGIKNMNFFDEDDSSAGNNRLLFVNKKPYSQIDYTQFTNSYIVISRINSAGAGHFSFKDSYLELTGKKNTKTGQYTARAMFLELDVEAKRDGNKVDSNTNRISGSDMGTMYVVFKSNNLIFPYSINYPLWNNTAKSTYTTTTGRQISVTNKAACIFGHTEKDNKNNAYTMPAFSLSTKDNGNNILVLLTEYAWDICGGKASCKINFDTITVTQSFHLMYLLTNGTNTYTVYIPDDYKFFKCVVFTTDITFKTNGCYKGYEHLDTLKWIDNTNRYSVYRDLEHSNVVTVKKHEDQQYVSILYKYVFSDGTNDTTTTYQKSPYAVVSPADLYIKIGESGTFIASANTYYRFGYWNNIATLTNLTYTHTPITSESQNITATFIRNAYLFKTALTWCTVTITPKEGELANSNWYKCPTNKNTVTLQLTATPTTTINTTSKLTTVAKLINMWNNTEDFGPAIDGTNSKTVTISKDVSSYVIKAAYNKPKISIGCQQNTTSVSTTRLAINRKIEYKMNGTTYTPSPLATTALLETYIDYSSDLKITIPKTAKVSTTTYNLVYDNTNLLNTIITNWSSSCGLKNIESDHLTSVENSDGTVTLTIKNITFSGSIPTKASPAMTINIKYKKAL